MARLLQTLMAVVLFSTLWDATLTFVNLQTIGWTFEANPVVSGFLGLILVKLVVLAFCYAIYQWYPKMTFDSRFIVITGLLALTAGQLYGGYSHVPIILENRLAESIEVGDGNYTIYRPDGTSTSYQSLPRSEATPYYFAKLFFIMTFPILFSVVTLLITRKTSPDLKIQKVKNV